MKEYAASAEIPKQPLGNLNEGLFTDYDRGQRGAGDGGGGV